MVVDFKSNRNWCNKSIVTLELPGVDTVDGIDRI